MLHSALELGRSLFSSKIKAMFLIESSNKWLNFGCVNNDDKRSSLFEDTTAGGYSLGMVLSIENRKKG
jgi:hypothetical protein